MVPLPSPETRQDGYPKNWPELTKAVMRRDGNCCTRCHLRNHLVGYRTAQGSFVQSLLTPPDLFPVLRAVWPTGLMEPAYGTLTIWHLRLWVALLKRAVPVHGAEWFWVKLGVAHLDSQLRDHRAGNLAALCAQCHLRLDLPVSVPRAVASRKYGSRRAESHYPLFDWQKPPKKPRRKAGK